jgi:hypothetical protein
MSATDGRLICDSDAVAANSSYTLATGKINEHQRCAQDVGVAWGSIFAYMMVCFGIGAVIGYVISTPWTFLPQAIQDRHNVSVTCFSVLG